MNQGAILALSALLACTPKPNPPPPGRFVILGFDGVDPKDVQTMWRKGELPHLLALSQRGAFRPLQTTTPPQSPVAWATFATGAEPAQHGIFDFVARDPASYMPRVATTQVTHASVDAGAVIPARARNLRRGDAFWDVAARHGVATTTLFVPYAYPPPPDGARSMPGLGTPDIRGINSSFTLLTTDPKKLEPAPAGGQVALLLPNATGWSATVAGPRVTIAGEGRQLSFGLQVRAQGERLYVSLGDMTSKAEALALGQTSQVYIARVVEGPLIVSAATRVTVRRLGAAPELYLEPFSIVPAAPYFLLSQPAEFASWLWSTVGPFKTVGWAQDTSALSAGAMPEEQFVREALDSMKWQSRAVTLVLRQKRDRLVVSVFTAPDRIAHMFMAHVDQAHPAHVQGSAYADVIERAYREMDVIVGEVQGLLEPQDRLVVMSDHGFATFRRGFHVNRWLSDQGFMTLRARHGGEFFSGVDWARTKAYALGTGNIYINVQGREAQGIVPSTQSAEVSRAIREGLLAVKDGARAPVLDAYLGDDIYSGPMRADAPDVRLAMEPSYRTSWATALGGAPLGLFEDNLRKWSGDHASARAQDVPGVLFTSWPVSREQVRIEDVAVTVLRYFGIEPDISALAMPMTGAPF